MSFCSNLDWNFSYYGWTFKLQYNPPYLHSIISLVLVHNNLIVFFFLFLILLHSNSLDINSHLFSLQQTASRAKGFKPTGWKWFWIRDQMVEWSPVLHAALEAVFQPYSAIVKCESCVSTKCSQSSGRQLSSLTMLQRSSFSLMRLSCKYHLICVMKCWLCPQVSYLHVSKCRFFHLGLKLC